MLRWSGTNYKAIQTFSTGRWVSLSQLEVSRHEQSPAINIWKDGAVVSSSCTLPTFTTGPEEGFAIPLILTQRGQIPMGLRYWLLTWLCSCRQYPLTQDFTHSLHIHSMLPPLPMPHPTVASRLISSLMTTEQIHPTNAGHTTQTLVSGSFLSGESGRCTPGQCLGNCVL